MKLSVLRDQFFAWLGPRKLSRSSIEAYRLDLEMITRELVRADDSTALDPELDLATTIDISHVTKDSLRVAFGRYSENHAKASILRAHSTWRQFFDYLVADGIVEGNPMAAINRPKPDERRPKPLEGWDEDTISRLLRSVAAGERKGRIVWPELDLAIIATLLLTGVRRSELLAMNVNAIEGEPGSQVLRVIGKGAKPRTIPVEPALDELLGTYLESRKARFVNWKQRPNDALFVGSRPSKVGGGTRMTSRQLDWLLASCMEAAGVGNRRPKGAMAHAFRHTYGSTLAADGAPVAAIRKLMGHSSINTSQGYIDSLAREERDVAAKNRVYDLLPRHQV